VLRRLVLCGLAGCGFNSSGAIDAGPGDAARDGGLDATDAPSDSSIDGPPAAGCYGSFAPVCLATIPTAPLDINQPLTIDTDTSPLCRPTANGTAIDACVLAGSDVTINYRVDARGNRPLVVIAITGQVTVNGTGVIDVSSQGATVLGAGAMTTCGGATTPGSRAGGPGGSFIGPGGNGGNGQGAGGMAAPPVVIPVPLRGGCPGGSGEGSSGLGGLGGGAVALIAPMRVTINGLVHAGGGGGRGGSSSGQNGGGGGGSGGSIWFDSPTVVINGSGRVTAQGGGGGQGSDPPLAGGAGADVLITAVAASGGAGGNGSLADGGLPGGTLGTGGGGGGGAGWVRSADPTPDLFGVSVPPPTWAPPS